MPRNGQSTWNSRPQPLPWCHHLQVLVCSDGRKFLVVAMGAIATAVAIAERDGPRISRLKHWQSPEDGSDGQNVHNSPEGSRRSVLSRIWRSTTLAKQNRVRRVRLLHGITYYYTSIRARGFQLDFIAEGDVCTLNVNGFFLANYFDGHGEKKLQLIIPDTVRLSTIRPTPGGRVKTKSSRRSRLFSWYVLLGKGQHCRRWCGSGAHRVSYCLSARSRKF